MCKNKLPPNAAPLGGSQHVTISIDAGGTTGASASSGVAVSICAAGASRVGVGGAVGLAGGCAVVRGIVHVGLLRRGAGSSEGLHNGSLVNTSSSRGSGVVHRSLRRRSFAGRRLRSLLHVGRSSSIASGSSSRSTSSVSCLNLSALGNSWCALDCPASVDVPVHGLTASCTIGSSGCRGGAVPVTASIRVVWTSMLVVVTNRSSFAVPALVAVVRM